MAIIILEKEDFKTKTIVTYKQGDCMTIKLAMSYEYITILNVYGTDDRAPKIMRQKPGSSKTEIDKSTTTVQYFKSIPSENDKKTDDL